MLVLELLINIVVAALLATTIAYCWILNKRIRILQDSRSELAALLKHFDESTERASESILALQSASRKIGETMQARIEKANYVADDLSFLIERAGRLSEKEPPPMPKTAPPKAAPDSPRGVPAVPSREAREAEEAVRRARAEAEDKSGRGGGAMSALQGMLEKLSARANNPQPSKQAAPPAARSRAEQELLELIRTNSKV